jgi:hypothetical protein
LGEYQNQPKAKDASAPKPTANQFTPSKSCMTALPLFSSSIHLNLKEIRTEYAAVSDSVPFNPCADIKRPGASGIAVTTNQAL